jgi:topoisomerase IV subunit A
VYELSRGEKGTRVLHFTVHDTEEESNEQVVTVYLKPALRLRRLSRPFHFGEMAIKGRSSKGNLVTRHIVDRVVRGNREEDDEGDDGAGEPVGGEAEEQAGDDS